MGPEAQDKPCELPFVDQGLTHFDVIPDARGFNCPAGSTVENGKSNSVLAPQWCVKGQTKFCPDGGWVMHAQANPLFCTHDICENWVTAPFLVLFPSLTLVLILWPTNVGSFICFVCRAAKVGLSAPRGESKDGAK